MKVKYFAGALLALSLTAPAYALSLGLPSLGGSKSASASADPAKVEQDLKNIIETTSIALSHLSEALGMKEEAAKFLANAECTKANTCGLSDAVGVVDTVSPTVIAAANTRKERGEKLGTDAAAKAAEALLPAVNAFPLWKKVADGVKDIDKSSALRFAGLINAAPKVPTAAKQTADVINVGISYLSFSGADTKTIQDAAQSSMKGLG